ncbi:MAG: hypothetical protein NTW46_00050 [Candidatus Nealsonbacteria bacterium]|nr:hypothetical protein [Candidatus Nealsonbacteria bacterium]
MDKPRMLFLNPDAKMNIGQLDVLTDYRFKMIVIDYFTRESIKEGEIGVLVSPEKIAKNPPKLVVVELEMPNVCRCEPQDISWGLDLLANLRRHPVLQMPIIAVCQRLPSWIGQPICGLSLRRRLINWILGVKSQRKRLVDLHLKGMFTWEDLKDPQEQHRFRELLELCST